MTEAPLNHPSDEALRALSLGQLAEADLTHVSAHLGDCPACCRRIDQLNSDDQLLARLQKGAANREKELVTPAQRRLAVRALRQAHEARSDTAPASGIANASAVQTHHDAPPSKGLPDELTWFLAPPERPDEIGRLGPYRVLKVLAKGGMGVVFRAHDPALDRPVALKAMLPSMAAVPNASERFLREARAAAALKHPHIVTIFQVGEDRGIPFLAMTFLEGEPLDHRIRREGRLPLAEVLRIGREAALGLAAAHARGLVHRDIKPANLWLEGPTGQVKILDFGLARALADQAHLTQSGMIVGTPAYMAPEQAEGKPVEPPCDLFSLGCVLYQMSTGTLPFHGETTIAVLRSLALHEPPAVDEVRPDAPPELSALVVRLLAKKPKDRPGSAQEVAQTLLALEQLPPRPILPKPETRPARKRRKLLVAVAGAALALVVVLALVLILWPTPHGTVRIESDDPTVEVVFDKDGPTIKGADKEPITLRAGEHSVTIDFAPGFVGWPNRALFVPGSQTVVFSNSVQGGVVWDLKDHCILRKFSRHGVYVHVWGLAVSPDGQQAVTGDDRGKILLWNVNTAQLVRTFAGQGKPISHLGFASDGKHFVSLRDDGEVCVWDPASGAGQKSPANCPVPKKVGDGNDPFPFTHSPDARHLLVGHPDGSLLWFEVATGKTLHRWKGHETRVRAVAVSPDGQFAVSGSEDGIIRLWDLRTQQLAELTGHVGAVNWLVFTPNNRRVVSGGADKTVRVWDLTTRKELQCFQGHTGNVTHVDVSSDGKYALSMAAMPRQLAKELAIVWRLPDEPGPNLPRPGAP
jgi:serine/threonine protein kinase